MFLKSNKPSNKIETIIGPETDIEGNINTHQSIRIDGKIKGEVRAEAVVVGDIGMVVGDITADRVTVGGKVKGNVVATTLLELLPKGQLLGDIRTNKLIISDGSHFEGNCQMQKNDNQVLELNAQNVVELDANGNQKPLKVLSGNGKR